MDEATWGFKHLLVRLGALELLTTQIVADLYSGIPNGRERLRALDDRLSDGIAADPRLASPEIAEGMAAIESLLNRIATAMPERGG